MLPGSVGAGAGAGMGTTFFETRCVGSSGYFYINIYYNLYIIYNTIFYKLNL